MYKTVQPDQKHRNSDDLGKIAKSAVYFRTKVPYKYRSISLKICFFEPKHKNLSYHSIISKRTLGGAWSNSFIIWMSSNPHIFFAFHETMFEMRSILELLINNHSKNRLIIEMCIALLFQGAKCKVIQTYQIPLPSMIQNPLSLLRCISDKNYKERFLQDFIYNWSNGYSLRFVLFFNSFYSIVRKRRAAFFLMRVTSHFKLNSRENLKVEWLEKNTAEKKNTLDRSNL